MKVLVLGASGFIGHAIATHLARAGHQVIRGVRRPTHPEDVAIDYTTDLTDRQWLPRLGDVDAVINAVGLIVERGQQTFAHLHTQAPIALFKACRMRGVRQIIQISALGAESRETPYFASKCEADEFLLAQPMQVHVIRPALVYGTAGTSARLFRALASFPVHLLPAGGHQRLQPVHIDDLAELVVRLLNSDASAANPPCIEVVGNMPVTYRDMLNTYRRSLELAPACAISIPACVMRVAAAIGGGIPASVLTPDTWRMLQRDNTASVQQCAKILGRVPRGIKTFVDSDSAPALRAEAFAAWQGLVLRIALTIVWIGSALVGAVAYPTSLALLGRLGLHGLAASSALYGACALDFGMGLATLLKPGRILWLVQMLIVCAYSVVIAIALPEFLLEPFGPILKNVPILAMLFLLFSEEVQP